MATRSTHFHWSRASSSIALEFLIPLNITIVTVALSWQAVLMLTLSVVCLMIFVFLYIFVFACTVCLQCVFSMFVVCLSVVQEVYTRFTE